MYVIDRLVKLASRPQVVIIESALPDSFVRCSCLADLPLRQNFDTHHDIGNGAAFFRKNYRMPMIRHKAVCAEGEFRSASN